MSELLPFLSDTLVGMLYACAFASLLVGYLWDYLYLSKVRTIALTVIYCAVCSAIDQWIVLRYGIGPAHLIVYLLTLLVIPYFTFFFLTRMPCVKYLYCLASISIQAFFMVGLLEYFGFSNDQVMRLPLTTGLMGSAGLAALDAAILLAFRRFVAPMLRDFENQTLFIKFLPLPLGGAVALGLFYFLTDFSACGLSVLLIFFACYLALFTGDIIAMRSIRIMIRATTVETRLQCAEQILSVQKEQYQRLKESIEQTRQARHDLRHHMIEVNGFLSANDMEGLKSYLEEYVAALPQGSDYLYTGNYAADIIIWHYLSLARHNGIEVNYNLHIPENMSIKDTDFCVLMGNCLENAIDACMRIQDARRFLQVESVVKGKYLAITIANSYRGEDVTQNEMLLSEKRLRASAGIGLESVGAVVRAYHGEMKVLGKGGVFTIYLMLNMMSKP